MNPTDSMTEQGALLARFTQMLSVRTLRHVAEEARLDAESLQQAVQRYEIDYAWHVLGSQRLQEACLAALGRRLGQAPSEPQCAVVTELLAAAAAAQPSDHLMSFDNDLPESLALLLCEVFERQALPEVQPG